MRLSGFVGMGLLFVVFVQLVGVPFLRWFISLPESVQINSFTGVCLVLGVLLLWISSRGDGV